jgi:pyruvate,water dikinase
MSDYIRSFQEVDSAKVNIVGGKGANLGELARIGGIQVPQGFCVTTEAYKEITGNSKALNSLLDELAILKSDNRKDIGETSAKIRKVIEGMTIPEAMGHEITQYLEQLGERSAYAVRSSATAEDLPTASFAGQQDTYLNIIGKESVLKYISKCWASLFTERAVIYRIQNGFDHRKVYLSVVIQKMVFPEVAGILFTADPVTSNRKILSIDASFGLGEALVSGLVNADTYKVRNGIITDKKISAKKLAIYAIKGGGTKEQEIEPGLQNRQALTDEQILQLNRTGRKIEAHFGSPQDIEWCLVDHTFYIVQSRPITTLYPIPQANDQENHVYISVGHQQMMTQAMKPLGSSLWQLTGGRPMALAGGRMFVDIARELASPTSRELIVGVLGKSDPLIKDALTTILERENFIQSPTGDKPAAPPDYRALADHDPAIVSELINRSRASIEALKQKILSLIHI